MKTIILTSSLECVKKNEFGEKIPCKIDNRNGFITDLKKYTKSYDTFLYVASNPNDFLKIDDYANKTKEALKLSGIIFKNFYILDNRTIKHIDEYIKSSNVIFLTGGSTYIQNEFFKSINLKKHLENYDGLIIGQSAGSLNLAKEVYNSPETKCNYELIYFSGLNLTNINIEPHFILNDNLFNEDEMFQREHILNESFKRKIYALCDGSYIIINDKIFVKGLSYIIIKGTIKKLCNDNEELEIK